MAMLIYTEMVWVIASPNNLCSHINISLMVVLHIFATDLKANESLCKLYPE